MFGHWADDVKKKHQPHQSRLWIKGVTPLQQKWGEEGWALQIHNQYFQSVAYICKLAPMAKF